MTSVKDEVEHQMPELIQRPEPFKKGAVITATLSGRGKPSGGVFPNSREVVHGDDGVRTGHLWNLDMLWALLP